MKPEVYIEDMYDPNDRIALVLVPRTEGAKTQQRIWTAEKAHPSRYSAGCDTTTPKATISTSA